MRTPYYYLAVMSVLATACGKETKDYDATGTFEATEVVVSAKSTGELRSFAVREGEMVLFDSVVGSIDAVQLQLKKEQLSTNSRQLDANKAQLDASRHATDSRQLDLERQVASIRQQIANARHEQQRFAELYRDGAVARKQVDDIGYQISVLEKQLTAAQDQLRSNNESLAQQSRGIAAQQRGIDAQQAGISVQQAQLDDQIQNTKIKSPITGMVLETYVERGEFVSTGKPLFKVADTQNMYIRTYVTTAQLQQVRVGQSVQVFADYGNGQKKTYNGTVSWISSRSEFTPKTILTDDERADLVYAVKVAVKSDGYLKIGMYGQVKF